MKTEHIKLVVCCQNLYYWRNKVSSQLPQVLPLETKEEKKNKLNPQEQNKELIKIREENNKIENKKW